MSRTILFTLGTKPVLAPTFALVQKITVMKTTLVTVKNSVSATRVQNLADMDAAGEEPSVKLEDYTDTLQVGKVTQVDVNEVVEKDESKNYETTLKALMANRDGLTKTVALLLRIVNQEYTIDSSSKADIGHIVEKAEGIDALANCLYGAELKRTVILDLAGELYRYIGFAFTLVAAPTTEELTSIITIMQEINIQIVAISKVILETQTLVIKHVGKNFDPKTMVVQIISVEESTYGTIVDRTPTVVEETPTSTTILSASEIEAKLANEVSALKLVLEHIVIVNELLLKIESGSIITGGSGDETSATVVVTLLIEIVVLITEEQFTSALFLKLLADLQAVTKVGTLTEAEQITIVSLVQIVALIESKKDRRGFRSFPGSHRSQGSSGRRDLG
jgi:hypothetical protein